ncbi:MAG: hypothetical protein GF421_11475 [Candidatus Aminicenantes bacterium]|nr:hypothetical protein [Candidatus Aminicenantes bacterium]
MKNSWSALNMNGRILGCKGVDMTPKSKIKPSFHFLLILWFSLSLFSSCQDDHRITFSRIQKIHSWKPRTLYRDFYTWPKLSPDGSRIAFIREGQLMVSELPEFNDKDVSTAIGFDRVSDFSWRRNSKALDIIGYKEKKNFVKCVDLDKDQTTTSFPGVWSEDAQYCAFYNEKDGRKGIWLTQTQSQASELVLADFIPRYMTFSHQGGILAVMAEDEGVSNRLIVYHINDNQHYVLHDKIDGVEPIVFSPDDQYILLSMVSDQSFRAEDIHKPVADRDLDIYSIHIVTGQTRKLYESLNEDVIIGMSGNTLYWTEIRTVLSVGLLSFDGGDISTLVNDHAFDPVWHPKGNKISYSYGQFRLMDFPMNWDIGSIELDGSLHSESTGYIEVGGFHEDMLPMWSPDGQFFAFHSHRSPFPVSSYREDGSTDGIWIKDTANDSEKLAVNMGYETAMCDWSPDGKKLVFTTIAPEDHLHKAWICELEHTKSGSHSIKPLLKEDLEGDVLAVSWSPLKHEIAIEEDLGGFKRVIWIADLADGSKRKIVEYTCMPRWGGLDFSTEGEYLIYAAFANEHHQLFKIKLDDLANTQLTYQEQELFHPQVSPDGDFIVCSVYDHFKSIWKADLK